MCKSIEDTVALAANYHFAFSFNTSDFHPKIYLNLKLRDENAWSTSTLDYIRVCKSIFWKRILDVTAWKCCTIHKETLNFLSPLLSSFRLFALEEKKKKNWPHGDFSLFERSLKASGNKILKNDDDSERQTRKCQRKNKRKTRHVIIKHVLEHNTAHNPLTMPFPPCTNIIARKTV